MHPQVILLRRSKIKVAIIVGTRPEIIKMSPIIKECMKRKLDFFVLHTGQHYSYNLDGIFFEQLDLPQPKYNLGVGSGTHAEEIGKILIGIEKVLLKEKPDIVLVEGDTSSALAGALSASKLNIKIGHVEAGLRSYDRQMPEEINRVLVDHCSDYLFVPTRGAVSILQGEGISRKTISLTGNTIVDVVQKYMPKKKKGTDYMLLTLHRQENVDDADRFTKILRGLDLVINEFNLEMLYPAHPRSRKMMSLYGLKANLSFMNPVGYFEFLELEQNAKLIFTDSGGVQEEACILGVPCVTLRDNTERPETVEVGANILAGASPTKILECAKTMLNKDNSWINPFGNGKAGEKIVKIIRKV